MTSANFWTRFLGRSKPEFSLVPKAAPKRAHVARNQVGLKRWYMMGPLDTIVLTSYGAKERRRRRAAGRVSKQSRKRNRGSYRG